MFSENRYSSKQEISGNFTPTLFETLEPRLLLSTTYPVTDLASLDASLSTALVGTYNSVLFGSDHGEEFSAGIGYINFDGTGNFAGEITEVSQGQSTGDAFDVGPVNGTYSIGSNGQLTLLSEGDVYDNGYVSADGSLIVWAPVPGDIPYEEAGISVGVKESSGLGVQSLLGKYNTVLFGSDHGEEFSAGIGYINFDGTGNFAGEITEVSHGQGSAFVVGPVDGTYSVSSNGQLTLLSEGDVYDNGYVSADGSLIVWATVPGDIPYEEAGITVCVQEGSGLSVQSLIGKYSTVLFGSDHGEEFTAGIGYVNFDGTGNFAGEITDVSNGQTTGSAFHVGPVNGTYSVGSNGQLTLLSNGDVYDNGYVSADGSLIVWATVPGDIPCEEAGITVGVKEVQLSPNSDLIGEFGNIQLYDTVVPGDKGKVSVIVSNSDTAPAPAKGKINIDFFLSEDQVLDGNDVLLSNLTNKSINIKPGSSKTFTSRVVIPGDIEPNKDYYLLADIDSTNVIAELNEDNNLAISDSTTEVVWQFGDFSGRKRVKLTLADTQGTPVTFELRSGGWGEVIGADFEEVVLHDATAKSAMSIKTKGRGAETSVGNITSVGSLNSIVAKTTDLRGDINIGGSLIKLVLDDVDADHDINIGATTDPRAGVSITLDEVEGLDLDSKMPIKSLKVTEWIDGSLSAPWVMTLSVKGRRANTRRGITALPGDLGANVTLMEANDKGISLNNAKINGSLTGMVYIQGNVGNITIGMLRNELTIEGDAKNIKIQEPLALRPSPVALEGGDEPELYKLDIGGTANVTSANERIKFTDNSLYAAVPSMYRLQDLMRFDVLGAWWEYDVQFRGTDGSGSDKETVSVENELQNDCTVVVTSFLGKTVESAYYFDTDGAHIVQMSYEYGGEDEVFGSMEFWWDSLIMAPEYLQLGQKYTDSATLSGSYELTVLGHTVTGSITGTADVSTKLVGHEEVTVSAGTYLAAELEASIVLSGTMQFNVLGRTFTSTINVTEKDTSWCVPGIGIVKEDVSGSGRVNVQGVGGESYRETLNAELSRYG